LLILCETHAQHWPRTWSQLRAQDEGVPAASASRSCQGQGYHHVLLCAIVEGASG
jgi:hypothetical protein